MRAVWYERHGAPHDVLELGEMPTPEPGHGEVQVRLEASGVNPADCYRRQGPGPMEFPRVVTHSDGAGVVDRVGPGVAASWVGQRVWLYNGQRNGRWMGTAAEYIALDADLVTPLADHVSFAEGATLGIPCMTAHRCVFMAGPVQGRTVLVTGGAGAVGHYAVQLAAWAGATVIATVSSDDKAARARAAGVAHVIDYRTQDVAAAVLAATGGAGVDHVVDVDFGGNLAATLAAVKQGGSVAVYATNGDRTPRLPVRELMQKNVALHFMVLPLSPHPARKRAQQDIAAWTGGGRRMLSVAAIFPLARTADAQAAVEAGGKVGTVVVEPQR
jgi:NADPH2:quinone reductase